MQRIEQIIKQEYQPSNTNVLWLDTSLSEPILKSFKNGKWVALTSGPNAVTYTEQDLTNGQQRQAKNNIDAASTDGYYDKMTVGSAEDLVNHGGVVAKYSGSRAVGGNESIGNGYARIKKIRGNCVTWNQIFHPYDSSHSTVVDGVTITFGDDGTITFNGKFAGTDNSTYFVNLGTADVIEDKDYYIKAESNVPNFFNTYSTITDNMYIMPILSSSYSKRSAPASAALTFGMTMYRNDTFNNVTLKVWIAESNTDFITLGEKSDYFVGTRIESTKTFGIETHGFNLYDYTNNKLYLFSYNSGGVVDEFQICGDYTGISGLMSPITNEGIFYSTAAYATPQVIGGSSNTLVHAVYSGYKNYGEEDYAFEDFWTGGISIDFTTVEGKLNGKGKSVKVCPDGLCGVGDVRDEAYATQIIKKIGKRDYQEGDELDNTVLTDGINTYYVLQTPETYTLNTVLPMLYKVDDFGIEIQVGDTSTVYVMPALDYDVLYAMNAVDTLRNLNANYLDKKQLVQTPGDNADNMLSQKGINDNYSKKFGVESNLTVGGAENLTSLTEDRSFGTLQVANAENSITIEKICGKSRVWGQLFPESTFASDSSFSGGVKFTNLGNHAVKVEVDSGGSTSTKRKNLGLTFMENGKTNHKYLLIGCPNGGGANTYWLGSGTSFDAAKCDDGTGLFVTYTGTGYGVGVSVKKDMPEGTYMFYYAAFDLTAIFGKGNEPTTLAEFKEQYAAQAYAYAETTILNNTTTNIQIYDSTNTLQSSVSLNLTTLTGKLNGIGESITICPNGLRSAGTVCDELIVENGYITKLIKRVDERNYISGDENYSTRLTSYVKTNYQLSTPLTYVLDTPIPAKFNIYENGSIKQIPENGYNQYTADMRMQFRYSINAGEKIIGLPEDYIPAEQLDTFLTALGTAYGGTWSRTYNTTTKQHEFTYME